MIWRLNEVSYKYLRFSGNFVVHHAQADAESKLLSFARTGIQIFDIQCQFLGFTYVVLREMSIPRALICLTLPYLKYNPVRRMRFCSVKNPIVTQKIKHIKRSSKWREYNYKAAYLK